MIVGANCVRPLMIDNENVVIYTKNAQNRNIFWRTQFAPTMWYDDFYEWRYCYLRRYCHGRRHGFAPTGANHKQTDKL